jgi:hypothetical protein
MDRRGILLFRRVRRSRRFRSGATAEKKCVEVFCLCGRVEWRLAGRQQATTISCFRPAPKAEPSRLDRGGIADIVVSAQAQVRVAAVDASAVAPFHRLLSLSFQIKSWIS